MDKPRPTPKDISRLAKVTQATIELDCPEEMLLGLHVSAEELRDEVKRRAAHSLSMPRVRFLMLAMQAGAEPVGDTQDDFNRETALL